MPKKSDQVNQSLAMPMHEGSQGSAWARPIQNVGSLRSSLNENLGKFKVHGTIGRASQSLISQSCKIT